MERKGVDISCPLRKKNIRVEEDAMKNEKKDKREEIK